MYRVPSTQYPVPRQKNSDVIQVLGRFIAGTSTDNTVYKLTDTKKNEEGHMKHAPAKEFRDLIVWQKAHGLALFIYTLSRKLPDHELYGLVSQIRRAVSSVPANIAEGFKKLTVADKLRYLSIAQSSLE